MQTIKKEIEPRLIQKIYNVIGYFYFYAFWGWFIETIYCFIINGVLEKRGYLYGIICPIYGFGAIILLYLLSDQRIKNSKVRKFILSAVICTAFELIVAEIIQKCFGMSLWDYSNKPLNFDGKICFESSLYWGMLGLFLSEVLQPAIEKIVKKINDNLYKFQVSLMVVVTILDFVLSTLKYLGI
jgi:uncharacterized membrane protein